MIYSSLIKPILFRKDAESAHDWAINMSSWANDSNLLSALVETLYNSENFGLEKNYGG